MSSKPKPKKMYFFVANDYFYCVPTRDIRTADTSGINIGDAVQFQYGSTVLEGEVMFMSSKEADVMTEIKKAKKGQRLSKEESFHSELPRKSAVKQREMMKDLQPGKVTKRPVKVEEGSSSKAESKKIKKRSKDRAEFTMETAMLATDKEQVEFGNDMWSDALTANPTNLVSADTDENPSTSSSIVNFDSSSSSIDAMAKVDKSALAIDLKTLKDVVPSSEGPTDDESRVAPSGPTTPGSMPNVDVSQVGSVEHILGGKTDDDWLERTETLPLNPDKERDRSPSPRPASKGNRSSSISSSASSLSSVKTSKCKKRKRKGKHSKKSKKAKKSKKSKKQKKSKRVDSSSDEDSDAEEKPEKKKRSKKSKSKKRVKKVAKPRGVKRNNNIYPGKMFLHSAETPGAVKVHKDFEVYIPENVRTNIIKESRSLALLVKHFVQNVFTKEALLGSTAQGFPNRVRGSDRLKQKDVLPKLDPNGRLAILQAATAIQEDKKHWRPRALPITISQHFSQAVGDEKEDSSSSSSSDTSSSSSDTSSSSSDDSN